MTIIDSIVDDNQSQAKTKIKVNFLTLNVNAVIFNQVFVCSWNPSQDVLASG